jgi:hypothetical protein
MNRVAGERLSKSAKHALARRFEIDADETLSGWSRPNLESAAMTAGALAASAPAPRASTAE